MSSESTMPLQIWTHALTLYSSCVGPLGRHRARFLSLLPSNFLNILLQIFLGRLHVDHRRIQ
jgi:hypothetical protein